MSLRLGPDRAETRAERTAPEPSALSQAPHSSSDSAHTRRAPPSRTNANRSTAFAAVYEALGAVDGRAKTGRAKTGRGGASGDPLPEPKLWSWGVELLSWCLAAAAARAAPSELAKPWTWSVRERDDRRSRAMVHLSESSGPLEVCRAGWDGTGASRTLWSPAHLGALRSCHTPYT